MAGSRQPPLRERTRQLAREIVLDAAERLLRHGDTPEFSMRALAAEAGVGFATPFNHFGSKNAIMQALSARLIGRMTQRFLDEAPTGDAIERVLAMARISCSILLEKAEVHRAVIGSLGIAAPAPGPVRQNSRELWSLALGDCAGLDLDLRERAHAVLGDQRAFTCRGCISFWAAGERADRDLADAFRSGACALLLGFVKRERRARLIGQIGASPGDA